MVDLSPDEFPLFDSHTFTPDYNDPNYIGYGERACTSCNRRFKGGHRDEMCPDCWAKFTRRKYQ